MKKILFCFLAISSFAITSCSSDDNKEEIVIDNSVSQKFIGKWKMVTGIIIYNGQTQTQDLKPGTCDYDFYDLKANGTKDEVYHDPENNCEASNWVGTWEYNESDNTITTIDSDDNYTMTFEIVEFSTNTMKVKLIEDGGEFPEDFGYEIYSILEK